MQQGVDIKYLGGINEDINPLDMKATGFYNARNFDNLDSDGSNFGNEVNVDGNRILLTIPDTPEDTVNSLPPQTNLKIINFKAIKNYIVVFTTNNEEASPTTGLGQIWLFKYNADSKLVSGAAINSLVYNGALNFSLYNKISSIEISYKSEDEILVYWADGYNNLRGCNVTDPELSTYSVDKFDMLSNFRMSEPYIANGDIIDGGGSIPVGAVQYVYRLRKGSIMTKLSTASNLYPIYEAESNAVDSGTTYGNSPGDESNKSCRVTIDINPLNSFYNEIEVYRIDNIDYESNPIVTKVYIGATVSSQIKFVDSGNVNLESLTLLDIIDLNDSIFKPKWISTGDNRLFAAGIKSDYFEVDYDARAYSFDYNSITSDYYVTKGDTTAVPTYSGGSWNTFNNDSDMVNSSLTQRYVKSSTLIGGSGPNVTYNMANKSIDLDGNGSISQVTAYGDRGGSNPYTSMSERNYQREETYRFGVVFFNSKGQQSFVIWIADIAMPPANLVDVADGGLGSLNGHLLGVNFTLTNIPIDLDTGKPYSYKIVRVKREGLDKTIIDQLAIDAARTRTATAGGVTYTPQLILGSGSSNTVDKYYGYSPALSFFKQAKSIPYSNLKLTIQSGYIGVNHPYVEITADASTGQFSDNRSVRVNKFYNRVDGISSEPIITKATFLSPNKTTSITSAAFDNSYKDAVSSTRAASGGSSIGIVLDTSINLVPSYSYTDDEVGISVVNVVRENNNQYGGNTYIARSINKYISASPLVSPLYPTSTVDSFAGDTFIVPFQVTNLISSFESNTGLLKVNVVPLESTINTYLKTESNPLDYWAEHGLMYRASWQERKGFYTYSDDETYGQSFDGYVYNSVYSKQDEVNTFFQKPHNFKEADNSDIIRYSSEQNNNSLIDGWRTFKTNDYQNVDSKFGGVESIHNWNGNVLFFQEGAFGLCKINERVLKDSLTDVSLVLGTGAILAKPVYKSLINGSIHGESVTLKNNKILFYDNIANGIMMYSVAYTGASSAELSKITGINKTMKTRFNSLTRNRNKLLNYDVQQPWPATDISSEFHVGVTSIAMNDDTYFTFFDVDSTVNSGTVTVVQDKDTVKFNSTLGKFSSYFDFSSPLYSSINGYMLSTHPTALNSIWIFEGANKGEYYDVTYDSEITFIVNASNSYNKLFTNIEYVTDVTGVNGDIRLETFNTARVWNEHQDTGEFDIIPNTNARRRTRRWSVTIPRALQISANDRKDARIRGRYLYAKLKYINNSNKKINLSTMNFRYSLSREDSRKVINTKKQ